MPVIVVPVIAGVLALASPPGPAVAVEGFGSALDGSARQPQGGAGGGRDAGRRRQGKDGVHQDLPALSLGSSAVPSRCATFFWRSMIASARSRRERAVRWAWL